MCVCVLFFFCNMWESEDVKSVNYREVCCRSLYCITLYRFVQGSNFKMTQISICTYLQRWGGWRTWCREMIREQDDDCRKKKLPLLLHKLLALFFFFFFLSSKCSSGLFVSFLLIVALAVAFVGALTVHATEALRKCVWMWLLHVLHVLLLTVLECGAANYCALLGWFFWFRKWTEFHALDAMETKNGSVYVFFYIHVCFFCFVLCVISTSVAKRT